MVLGTCAALVALSSSLCSAADWRSEYSPLVISSGTSENEADRIRRYKPFTEYLEKTLNVPIKYYVASDYAGAIEGVKARKVHFARMGSASYAAAYDVTDGGVEPLLVEIDSYDSTGYHSVICVKSDSPYESIQDLKGKSLAFADPNSTSGFLVPTYYLRKMGMDYDKYFGKTGFAGNHEMGVLAVKKGTYDACCTWYSNEVRSNLSRMAGKGMLKFDEDNPGKSDVRIIWKSPLIPNGPWYCRKELPEQMKKDVTDALYELPRIANAYKILKEKYGVSPQDLPQAAAAHEAWMALTDGELNGYKKVTHGRWADIIEMRRQNLKRRKGE
jgi:phosphonate transport system substrate-binding protein